jgi:trimethylamine--corrinoid protein Co-methyltransferase
MRKYYQDPLDPSEIQAIHDTSMRIMQNIGIRFPHEKSLDIFRSHGFTIEGEIVFFTEEKVMEAIGMVPGSFKLHARNPHRDVLIGNGCPIFAPGYGAPFLIDAKMGKRLPTMQDYHNLACLAHCLPNQDLSGHLMIEPNDVPSSTSHLLMLHANMIHSDKPLIGSSSGKIGSENTIQMAEILFGSKLDKPVVIGLLNPLSPLSYSPDTLDALCVYAEFEQPLILATLVMAGTTGPVTLAGVLAQQNAELLAGIVLTQLINPGTPVLFGSSSTIMDLRTSTLSIGSPELSMCTSAHAQLARFYGLPSRGGGALTDASMLDSQAGFESMFSLLTAINSGVDLIMHAAGIMSSFIAFSYEKFVLDDEMCGMVRHLTKGIEVNAETLAYEVIADIGHGGHFLGHRQTLERCRSEFWLPQVLDRDGLGSDSKNNHRGVATRARKRWLELLESHQDPPLEKLISRQLTSFVAENTGIYSL